MKYINSNLTLRTKILKSMTLVATGLMLLLAVAASSMYYSYFLRSTTISSISQIDYIAGQLDYYINSTSNYSLTLMTDAAIQKSLIKYLNNPKYFTAMDNMKMKDSINHTIQSTPFIHSVTFYSNEKELICTTEYYPSDSMPYIPTSVDDIWFFHEKRSNLNKKKKLYVLSMVRPVYSIATGHKLGYIEIAIPENIIASIYSDNTDSEHHIFIVDNLGKIKSTDTYLPLESIYENFPVEKRTISINHISFSQYIPKLKWYIISSISFTAFFRPLLNFLLFCILAVVVCIIICFFLSRQISRTITSPLYELIDHTRRIKSGNWSTIDTTCDDEDIALLFTAFNSMLKAQEKLTSNLVETTKQKNKISLDLIQQQVNPHFLYNTLDNICSLAELDEKQTLIDIVMNLSTFYRVGLSKGRFRITIGEELEITTAYIHIMQIRYFNKFNYNIQCPEYLKKYSCIKLLLQPIVENSIYHGIKEMEGLGQLDIIITEMNDNILITIQDNGVGFSDEAYEKIKHDNNHFGINSIDRRIKLYYGEYYGITIENKPQGGSLTRLTIPKKENTSDVNNTINS